MRPQTLWQVYLQCPDCKVAAGQPCQNLAGPNRKPPSRPHPRRRTGGGDRHAGGGEISCSAGACKNLAIWLLVTDLRWRRNWPSCGLHLASRKRLMVQYKQALSPEVVPLEDPRRPAPRVKTRPAST